MPRLSLLLALVLGCSSNPRLKDIPQASLAVHLSQAAGGRFTLQVVPVDSACKKPSPEARATLNGVALTRMKGKYALGDVSYDRDCILEFGFPGTVVHETRGVSGAVIEMPDGMDLGAPLPAQARSPTAAALRIDDDTAGWAFDILDAFTARTLSFVAPANGALKRGQKATLRWTPASDALTAGEIGLVLRGTGAASLEEAPIRRDAIRVEGDRLTFTVPADAPEAMNGIVQVHVLGAGLVKPGTGPCPVSACKVTLDFAVEPLAASLSP